MAKRYADYGAGSSWGAGAKRSRYNPGPPYRRKQARGKTFRRLYKGYGVRPGSRLVSSLAARLGVEKKFYDSLLSASAIASPPASASWAGLEQNPATFLCLNCPTQGSGASNREGRLINMDSLQLTGSVRMAAQADQTAADIQPIIKIWIVLDKQTNGGTATGMDSENLMTNPTATALGGIAPLRNMLFSKRYKVLKEILIDTAQLTITYDGANVEQSGREVTFQCFIPLKGMKVEFNASAGTVGDIVTNGLFVCAATSNTTCAPALTYNARLRFRG